MSVERKDNNTESGIFLLLSQSEINNIIELIILNKDERGINLSAVTEKIKEKISAKERLIDDLLGFIFTSSILYYENRKEYDEFIKSYSKQKNEINNIVKKLMEKQIFFNIYKFFEITNLETFGV